MHLPDYIRTLPLVVVYTFTIYDKLDRKPACAGKAGLNECVRVVRLGSHDPDDIFSRHKSPVARIKRHVTIVSHNEKVPGRH